MPTVFIEGDYAFRFYSSDCPKQPHIHVHRRDDVAKVWLLPSVKAATNRGFSAQELAEILALIHLRHGLILASWEKHFHEN